MPWSTQQWILSLTTSGLAFAAGIAIATFSRADSGDILAMAGALVGAAASVWGAFAVSTHSVARERREAEELVIKFVTDLESAMSFLERVQSCEITPSERDSTSRRIDRILVSIPGMTELLAQERLGARTGRARFMGETLRLSYQLKQIAPAFEQAFQKRCQIKGELGTDVLLDVEVPPDLIKNVKIACAESLLQLRTGGHGIAPATGNDS